MTVLALFSGRRGFFNRFNCVGVTVGLNDRGAAKPDAEAINPNRHAATGRESAGDGLVGAERRGR